MTKKFIFIFALLFCPPLYANLNYVGENQFIDTENNRTINYPCSYGGQALAIWSHTDASDIRSDQPIEPSYVYPGFQASPLIVAQAAQVSNTSKHYLLIQSPNPSDIYHGIQFGLNKAEKFFVVSVNFSPAKNTDILKASSVMKIVTDGEIFNTLIPYKNESFIQDTGILLNKNVNHITLSEYTWNQNTPWYTEEDAHPTSIIEYRFSPEKNDLGNYNGFGFWICGLPTVQTADTVDSAGQSYQDKIK